MARTERPAARSMGDRLYDALFHNYVWQSIFRSGYPNTPRNQMLVVATNVFLREDGAWRMMLGLNEAPCATGGRSDELAAAP